MKMTMTAKVDFRDKLLSKLKKIHQESVSVGYFQEQGEHYSGMTYPELMAVLEFGTKDGRIPPRLMKHKVAYFFNPPASNKVIKNSLSDYFKVRSNTSITQTFTKIAEEYRHSMWQLFGNIRPSNADVTIRLKGFNSPYIDTGDLNRNLSYKLSFNGTVIT